MEEDKVFRGQRNDRNRAPCSERGRPGSGVGSAFLPQRTLASQGMPGAREACRSRGSWFLKAGLIWGRTLQTFSGEGSGPSPPPLNSAGVALKQRQVPNGHGGVPVKLY